MEVDLLGESGAPIGRARIEEVRGVKTELELSGRTVSLISRGEEEQLLEVDRAVATVTDENRALIDLLLEISVGALTKEGSE